MPRKTRKTFSNEFKRDAVALLERGDKPGAQIARELGVKRNQLYKWKAEIDAFGEEAFPGSGRRSKGTSTSISNTKTTQLEAEIKKLREENEILKKAAIYFAKETK